MIERIKRNESNEKINISYHFRRISMKIFKYLRHFHFVDGTIFCLNIPIRDNTRKPHVGEKRRGEEEREREKVAREWEERNL
jgi:hypothetical protein